MKTKHNLFAVVEKDSDRAISIIESVLKPFYERNMKNFDVLPVLNTGTSSIITKEGIINAMSIYVDSDNDDDEELVYYIITDWPDKMSLGDAHKLIGNNRNSENRK